jgi:hypothetical protein
MKTTFDLKVSRDATMLRRAKCFWMGLLVEKTNTLCMGIARLGDSSA